MSKYTHVQWTGVVEDTNDPLKVGRMKVRIFGWHSENLNEIPTDDLPWAIPILPVNASKSFETPLEGDYVIGYFGDGENAQMPIVTGVFSGFLAKAYNTSQGFSPQSQTPIKTDKPSTQIGPKVGETTISKAARSIYDGTAVAYTNANLDHACDFRFQLDLGLELGQLINPAVALQQAIQNGKNRAATQMRMIVQQINDELRIALKAIVATMGVDPSGQLSYQYSYAKDIFREINKVTKKVAQYVEDAAFIYNMVTEIQQIVDYIKSLPARFQAILQQCVSNFLSSVESVTNQVKSLPGVAEGSLATMLNSLQTSATSTLATVNASAESVALPAALTTILTNPDANAANTYLNTTYANTETTLAESQANTYDKTQTSAP